MVNSANATLAAKSTLRVRRLLCRAAFLAVMIVAAFGGPVRAADNESEARALFTKFVAAQNAHNAGDVRAMLWNSPRMLWFTRGVEVRGADAVADRMKEYYEGTWHLEPDMSKFEVTAVSDDVVQILVPIVFTRGLPGKPPQDNMFLIGQTLVRSAGGWHFAAIMPIANTQLK